MNVLLTGGTGYLGKTVARALAARGHAVRVLARPGSDLSGLPSGLEIHRGDVTCRASMVRGAEGQDAVVHMAALVKMWMPDRRVFDEVNVGGLRHALEAARGAGARLLYTSSFIAVGPTGAEPVDETRVHPGRGYRNDYERTKVLADVLARQAAAAGQDVVTIYPGVVYGPGDLTDGNLVARMITDHLTGASPGIIGPGDRLWSYAHADDVAEGAVSALEKGRAGERYFLCGENVDLVGFYARLHEAAGIAPPTRHLPYGVAKAVGYGMYLWAELTGLPPRLTHEVVGVLREHWAYSSAKAGRELGYRARTLAEGLTPTVAWLRARLGAA